MSNFLPGHPVRGEHEENHLGAYGSYGMFVDQPAQGPLTNAQFPTSPSQNGQYSQSPFPPSPSQNGQYSQSPFVPEVASPQNANFFQGMPSAMSGQTGWNVPSLAPAPAPVADDGQFTFYSRPSSVSAGSPESGMGSPLAPPTAQFPQYGTTNNVNPTIMGTPDYMAQTMYNFGPPAMDDAAAPFLGYADDSKPLGFVDPSLLNPNANPKFTSSVLTQYDNGFQQAGYPNTPGFPNSLAMTSNMSPNTLAQTLSYQQPSPAPFQTPMFPAPSPIAMAPALMRNTSQESLISQSPVFNQAQPLVRNMSQASSASYSSDYNHPSPPIPVQVEDRRVSVAHREAEKDPKDKRERCPWPDCGKMFKDLRSHKVTHLSERPEKCPVKTCEYHTKGFARKYDRVRHTLTHFKGKMVCPFCTGPGSESEKHFNRADVFKRHLAAVHHVVHSPPNGGRRNKDGSKIRPKPLTAKELDSAPPTCGKCATCGETFRNAQDFFEHLEHCVEKYLEEDNDLARAVENAN